MLDAGSKRFQTLACWFVPLLFGLWSLALGQDSNWDQSNYHLYNGFAFLNRKLGIDLAPAGIQSYFNPLLDAVSYLLYTHFPAPFVGFLLGTWHGMTFVVLLFISRRVVGTVAATQPGKACFFLALAGCLTANFLSGLGNTMGDDTTAVIVLLGVASCLRALPYQTTPERVKAERSPMLAILLGGILVGLASGLKLTNAVYAVALVAALSICMGPLWQRISAIVLGGIGVLIGLGMTGGFWFVRMWETFHNPVFPMFSHLFPNPLVGSAIVGDAAVWLPKNTLEALLWPFIFALNSYRVGQVRIHQIIWPALYLLFFAWMAVVTVRAARRQSISKINAQGAFVLMFVAVGYLVWMKMFSIYRYLVPIEMLAPLAIYILLVDCVKLDLARRSAIIGLSMATLLVLIGGAKSWGHQKWAKQAFTAEVPHLLHPASDTVIIIGESPPYGWLVPFFPKDLAFSKLDGNFPKTAAYDDALAQMIARRQGNVYAIVSTDAVRKGQTSEAIAQINEAAQHHAADVLAAHEMTLVPASCTTYQAKIGQGAVPYQWCKVTSAK